jgi:D-sedoheptulose 7-phosphate isomerase
MVNTSSSVSSFHQTLVDTAEGLYAASDQWQQPLQLAAQAIVGSLTSGGKVMCAGQGDGQWLAQQATHFLLQGHERMRPPLAAMHIETKGTLSSQVMALGQSNDIWLVFAMPGDHADILAATRIAIDLDMTVLLISGTLSDAWSDCLRDTDLYIPLPGRHAASLFSMAWMALHGLCDAVDSHLLGEES